MPSLPNNLGNDLTGAPVLCGREQGAYMDPRYVFEGLDDPYTLTDVLVYLLDNTNGGGILQYEAEGLGGQVDQGCFVTTTKAGCQFQRTGGAGQNTEGILIIPAGSILRGISIHIDAAQAPGNTYYLNLDYQETGKAVNGSQQSVMPILATVSSKPATFSDSSPATNYVHSSTPLMVGIASVNDNGSRVRVRIKIQNYNQQVGANPSILTIIFP